MSVSQVSQAVNGLPRWALPGGQMANDPLVQRVVSMIEVGLQLNPDLDVEPLFYDMLTGTAVAYEQPKDSDRKENLDYAPVETVGEFWVIQDDLREKRRWSEALTAEVERTDQAQWRDPFEEERFDPFDDDEDLWDEDEFDTFVPGTSPYQEFIDNQRSRMVDDIYRAKSKGKKWGASKALLVVALAALNKGKSFQRARGLGFTAHALEYPSNITKRVDGGFIVRTTRVIYDLKEGETVPVYKEVWRFFPEEYIRICWEFLPKTSKKRIRQLTLGS